MMSGRVASRGPHNRPSTPAAFNLEQAGFGERRHGPLSLVLPLQAGFAADLGRYGEMIGAAHAHKGLHDEGKAADGARQGADPFKWNWTCQKQFGFLTAP
jgi:hypothetical protein